MSNFFEYKCEIHACNVKLTQVFGQTEQVSAFVYMMLELGLGTIDL